MLSFYWQKKIMYNSFQYPKNSFVLHEGLLSETGHGAGHPPTQGTTKRCCAQPGSESSLVPSVHTGKYQGFVPLNSEGNHTGEYQVFNFEGNVTTS